MCSSPRADLFQKAKRVAVLGDIVLGWDVEGATNAVGSVSMGENTKFLTIGCAKVRNRVLDMSDLVN